MPGHRFRLGRIDHGFYVCRRTRFEKRKATVCLAQDLPTCFLYKFLKNICNPSITKTMPLCQLDMEFQHKWHKLKSVYVGHFWKCNDVSLSTLDLTPSTFSTRGRFPINHCFIQNRHPLQDSKSSSLWALWLWGSHFMSMHCLALIVAVSDFLCYLNLSKGNFRNCKAKRGLAMQSRGNVDILDSNDSCCEPDYLECCAGKSLALWCWCLELRGEAPLGWSKPKGCYLGFIPEIFPCCRLLVPAVVCLWEPDAWALSIAGL